MPVRWTTIHKIWVRTGALAGAIFITWSLLAYRATSRARAALDSDARVTVTQGDGYWVLRPASPAAAGVVFFAGALVDPVAYAPLMRSVAEAGYMATLVGLPRRGVMGGADGPEVFARARAAMTASAPVGRWVFAGHSRGGVVASMAARDAFPGMAGLVLIGTSHPRDFSLAHLQIPVTRVFGSRDTVADEDKLDATRPNLPAATRLVRIDGGNHSQFGNYGFQPGDWPATISREAQQSITRAALLDALAQAAR
jgi:pimeloyl-ACP methyl ester carboxylesterase